MVAQLNNSLTYDESQRRFILPNGRVIEPSELLLIVEVAEDDLGGRLEAVTERLLSGEITLEEWELLIAQDLKGDNILIALLAIGGLATVQAMPRDRAALFWGNVGDRIRNEFRGLDRSAKRIAKGQLTAKQIRSYVRYKANSLRGTFERTKKLGIQLSGFNEALRRLDPSANHCPDCPGYETANWIPIENVIPVGHACRCGGRCRCSVIYRFNPSRVFDGSLIEQVQRSRQVEKDAHESMVRKLHKR